MVLAVSALRLGILTIRPRGIVHDLRFRTLNPWSDMLAVISYNRLTKSLFAGRPSAYIAYSFQFSDLSKKNRSGERQRETPKCFNVLEKNQVKRRETEKSRAKQRSLNRSREVGRDHSRENSWKTY
ncbi:hypothetical protein VNO77_18779 [Canavalia gladiata]|uniref:Uncharacterized protein n=1 Tax=Canavalia gladiata TaxID=3824 RepID=A0AAN9QJY4_CANGL